jgi:ribosomal protein RSM22 (predicted rRNA methylase)
VAKPNSDAYARLPLSQAFFELLARVGQRHKLPVGKPELVASAVAALSHTYTRGRDGLDEGARGQGAELARLVFFLPRDLPKVFGPLQELVAATPQLFTRPLRILDLGAGLGTTSLGIARYLRLAGLDVPRLDVHAVERDGRALALFRAIARELPALSADFLPMELTEHAQDLGAGLPDGPFDLICCGLVLNELGDEAAQGKAQADLLATLSQRLSPAGALIVLEPASKAAARALMAARDALVEQAPHLHLVAPCLHRGPCPMLQNERDWCHQEARYALGPTLTPIAKAAGLRYEGLSYASLVLSRAAGQPVHAEGLYRVVSDPLPSKGKRELYGCSGRGYVRLTRLSRDESPQNQAFSHARRGDLLAVGSDESRIGRDTQVALGPAQTPGDDAGASG